MKSKWGKKNWAIQSKGLSLREREAKYPKIHVRDTEKWIFMTIIPNWLHYYLKVVKVCRWTNSIFALTLDIYITFEESW